MTDVMGKHLFLAIGLVAAATVSCAGRQRQPGTKPEDMSADQHRAQAEDHQRTGQARTAYPGGVSGSGRDFWNPSWYPWTYTWDADAHAAAAQQHVRAAEELEEDYRAACAPVAPGAESKSPIDAYLQGVEDVDDGVVLHLAPEAGPPDQLLMHLRCHRAWLAVNGLDRVPDSPLGVRGLRVEVRAVPGGVDVTLTSDDSGGPEELRRRAVRALEQRGLDPER
jgi:hypothetical protein